ncbi:hypothetical protein K0T92_16930 [Paenibacillus oenotherae]|uniref:Uncharacterized protein n=1 Tax=Paenibacillus oenotherae TaxID=1435645 RepID=A0ABS7D907_9BACL|nr:hypothetical protein [Paenibacillus oenotherae]MBW7476419.1 hypothetical protein [Paenibacillus oenotherae]
MISKLVLLNEAGAIPPGGQMMRAILMSVLFIIVAVVIYANVIEGDEGTKIQVERSGSRMSDSIRSISP